MSTTWADLRETVTGVPVLARSAGLLRADLPGPARMPSLPRFIAAAVLAIGCSLVACWVVSAATIALDPALAGYGHLAAPDWSKLVLLGVPPACLGWPLAAAIWSRARAPFLLLTVLVTVVSFAPDAWIQRQGQPAGGVLALAVMHVAVAAVTWPALVLVAPQRRSGRRRS